MKKFPVFLIASLIGLSSFLVYDAFIKDSLTINKMVKKVKGLVEEKRWEECFHYVSRNYEDSRGWDVHQLREWAGNFFDEFNEFKVIILKKNIKIRAKRCDLELYLIMDTSHKEFGEMKGREFVRFLLVKEEDAIWRVIKGERVD